MVIQIHLSEKQAGPLSQKGFDPESEVEDNASAADVVDKGFAGLQNGNTCLHNMLGEGWSYCLGMSQQCGYEHSPEI